MLCWLSGMDNRYMDDSNNNRNEENFPSQSSKALHESRSIELGDTDDKQEPRKCHHFSIRGYVSEIRKTNREICWPFHIIDKHYKLEEHANLLPPMVVTEYRWWGCQSCLHKGHNIETAIDNAAATNNHNLEKRRLQTTGTFVNGNPVVESRTHAPISLPDFHVTSRETILGEGSDAADSFINRRDSLFLQSACCHGVHMHGFHFALSEGNQNLLSQTPACGGMSCKGLREEQTHATEIRKTAAVSEAPKTGYVRSEHGTANVSWSPTNMSQNVLQNEKTLRQGGNAHHVTTRGLEETKLSDKISETKYLASKNNSAHTFRPEDAKFLSVRDMTVMKEVLQGVTCSVQRPNKSDIEELVGVNYKESKCNGDLVESQDDDQNYPSHLDTLSVIFHRRKARKVRMLNDIIKSEVLGSSGQVRPSYRDEVIQSRDSDHVEIGASKDEKPAADCNLNIVSKEKERKLFVTKKRIELPEGEDEGPSLMQWLRRVPKKVKTQKCDEEHKPADNKIVASQSVTDVSSGKCLHSGIGIRGHTEDTGGKAFEGGMPMNTAQVDAVHARISLQQVMTNNNHGVVEGESAQCVNVGKALPKLVVNHCTLYSGLEHYDDPCREVIVHKKQNITCDVERDVSSPVNWLKDSIGTSECEIHNVDKGLQLIPKKRSVRGKTSAAEQAVGGAPVIREMAAADSIRIREKHASVPIREKQAATPMSEKLAATPVGEKESATLTEKDTAPTVTENQAVVDGIPIEILELLQSNYHKNHRLNLGHSTARAIESSETNNNVRDGSLGRSSNITEPNSNAVPSSQHKNKSALCSGSGNTGSSASNIGKHTGNSKREPIGKHTGNSNGEPIAHTSHCGGKRKRQIKVKEGPATSRESPDANLSLALPINGTQTPNTEPTGGYCPQNHSWSRVMLHNIESGYNALTISRQPPCRCFPHGAIQINNPHKFHAGICNSRLLPQTTLERNPSKVIQDSGGLKLLDMSLGQLNKIKQKVDVKNKKTLSSGNVHLEAEKECCSKMMQPLDLYRKDTISAMHLLRLMDPAVGSTASPLCPPVNNDPEDLLSKRHHENHYQKDFVGVGLGMRSKEAFNYLGMSEHQIYNQTNYSNFVSLVPRCSALESFSQKEISSLSNNYYARDAFNGINSSEDAFSFKPGKEKRKGSHLAVQAKLSKQRPQRNRHSQSRLQSILNSASYTKPSAARENVIQVDCKNKEEVEFSERENCQTELCVINRNPADFSLPDENNVYMIGYEDLRPRDVSPKWNKQYVHADASRQHRIPKLSASKGIVRH